MGNYEDMGITVYGLDDDVDEDFKGGEEIFRFEIFLSTEHEIEFGLQMAELDIEEIPRVGDEYRLLSNTYADLVIDHIGLEIDRFMNSIAGLSELDVELTSEEKAALRDGPTNEHGSFLLYTFHVLVMTSGEGKEYIKGRSMGCGFDRSSKADVMRKVYGEAYITAEDKFQEKITDAILDHGILFMKAVESVKIPE